MTRRRVVLTGLGTLNPLAHSVDDYWRKLVAGTSGIAPVTRFDVSPYTSRIGGEVKNWQRVPEEILPARETRRMDRFAQFALTSAVEAVADSQLRFDAEDLSRCAAIVGTGIGGLETLEEQHAKMLDRGLDRASPFTVPRMMGNAGAGNIAIYFGLCGPNFAVVTACASATNAIGEAAVLIQRDVADVVLTGGSEAALSPIGMSSFCALKGLSTRNDEPARASRPFDADRDGFLLSEGAGIVILEELEHARARDAKIYAELIGYAATCDAHHITAPEPEGTGASAAIRLALKDAGVAPDQVEYVNTHGTSTVLGDIAEVRAIKRVFGDHATNGLMVSSTKSCTGHLLGASGGIETIAVAKTIETGVLPPTMNLDHQDEECDLDCIPNVAREKQVDIVLKNSFGFGGHNACLLFKRFQG